MGDEAPERLFYGTMLREVFRVFADASRGRGISDGLDPDVFATAPEMIAVSFDARPYMDRKLSALSKVSLDDEDRASLERMRSLADLIREQGKDLTALWDSGKTEDEARYENTRKDAWAAISKLMGIGR